MQLTKHTDYAFRVLIYLAGMRQAQTTIRDITESFDISKTHLMKVVNALSSKGWVLSTRGKYGGIRLGVDPSEVNLREVVEYMESTLDPINCETPMCKINGACKLKPILYQAQQAFLAHLGAYTLADLADAKTALVLGFTAE